MAFTVYGPGIRDEIYLDTLFRHPVVGQVVAAHAVQPVAEQPVFRETVNRTPLSARSRAQEQERQKPAIENAPSKVLASNIMSAPVITMFGSDFANRVYELFAFHGFRHIPVLDSNSRLVIGIVSDRDMFRVPVPPNSGERLFVEHVMHNPVVTATPDTAVADIASALYKGRIGALPVVDDTGNLLGIITRSDIMKLVMNSNEFDLWI
jgi:CBS domain-containing protein